MNLRKELLYLMMQLGGNINREASSMVCYGSYEILRIVGIVAYELASVHRCASKVTSQFASQEEA